MNQHVPAMILVPSRFEQASTSISAAARRLAARLAQMVASARQRPPARTVHYACGG